MKYKNYLKILLSVIILSIGIIACNNDGEQTEQDQDTVKVERIMYADTLNFKWETPAELSTPESVKFDMDNSILYVANINGKPTDLDGNGFISKVSLEGKIIEKEWVTGLNAPKGMGIFDDKLYVTDINRLVEISIEKGEIINEYITQDAEFLNDIDIDIEGNVYASDMASDRIFRLNDGKFDVWLQSDEFVGPNGLLISDNNLYVGVQGKILSVYLKTKEINTFIDSTGGIDGLEAVKNDQYVFSDWSGHIHMFSPGKGIKLILNTAKDTIQAADIEYCPEKDLILVPTFYHNTVSAYKIERK